MNALQHLSGQRLHEQRPVDTMQTIASLASKISGLAETAPAHHEKDSYLVCTCTEKLPDFVNPSHPPLSLHLPSFTAYVMAQHTPVLYPLEVSRDDSITHVGENTRDSAAQEVTPGNSHRFASKVLISPCQTVLAKVVSSAQLEHSGSDVPTPDYSFDN